MPSSLAIAKEVPMAAVPENRPIATEIAIEDEMTNLFGLLNLCCPKLSNI